MSIRCHLSSRALPHKRPWAFYFLQTIGCIAAILIFSINYVHAQGVSSTWSCSKANDQKTCSFEIQIRGEITPETVKDVKKALNNRHDMTAREGASSEIWIIRIDSAGGNVQAAFDLGRLLRSVDAPVEISPNAQCVSACTLVLAGATRRIILGRVGIHRPYFDVVANNDESRDLQHLYTVMVARVRAYLREMNVSERFGDDMMTIEPERVRFLSESELASYGLGAIDPVTKEKGDLKEVKKLGINRQEYMRRKALSQTICKISTDFRDRVGNFISEQCYNAILLGKHVERAPPCPNAMHTCKPWEREWKGREPNSRSVVSEDGFLISDDK